MIQYPQYKQMSSHFLLVADDERHTVNYYYILLFEILYLNISHLTPLKEIYSNIPKYLNRYRIPVPSNKLTIIFRLYSASTEHYHKLSFII